MNALKKISLLLFMYCIAAAALAQAKPEFTPEHLAVAERIVYAMALPERFIIPTKEMIDGSKAKDPDNADLMTSVFAPYLDKHYTATQLAPFFASRFDLETSRQIAAFWEGPVGKKLVKTKLQLLTTGSAPKLVYNRKEKAILQQFEKTAAGQAMLQTWPEIEEVLTEFTSDTQTEMRNKFLLELEKRVKSSS